MTCGQKSPDTSAKSGQALDNPISAVRIIGVGTATPPSSYTQNELLDLFQVKDRRIRSLFLNSAIERRFLTLPTTDKGIHLGATESQGQLLARHRQWAITIGRRAVINCLESLKLAPSEISHICCTTTTGFLTPGISSLLSKDLGLSNDCSRLDVVGMGCNAGLNALNSAASWSAANPGRLAILLCAEICSAGYVFDDKISTSVTNSLFGDGAAAIALISNSVEYTNAPLIVKFKSRIITSELDSMRYDWDDQHAKFSFVLDRDVPYVIGAHIRSVVDALLEGTGLHLFDINHWIVHSGGKKVIDAVRINLGLSPNDLRHTLTVLRDYGNLSSGSFLFSYQRLLLEQKVNHKEYGIMITMGPGISIECALLRW